MLKRFEVSNYKGFQGVLTWDLSATRDYAYKKGLVENKIAKKSVVFGENGSGKSSLCTAIVDITAHLLDVQKDDIPKHMYTYIGNDKDYATFSYTFKFGKSEVLYSYAKTSLTELLWEKIEVNRKKVLFHDFVNEEDNFIKISGAERLRTKGLQNTLSVVKYIYNNTIQDENSVITKIINFVSGMLYFRSLKDANKYIGYKLGNGSLDEIILNDGRLEDFNLFIRDMGFDYNLVPLRHLNGITTIGVQFDNGNVIQLESIASSGTKTLMLFYCWFMEFSRLTFLVIDEFDAYYHYELSEKILNIIHSFENMQSMVTTHTISLLKTNCTRPDCAFILDKSGISNLCSRTQKELREVHNIEKLYREKEFLI